MLDDVERPVNMDKKTFNRKLRKLQKNFRKGFSKDNAISPVTFYLYNNLNDPDHPIDAMYINHKRIS